MAAATASARIPRVVRLHVDLESVAALGVCTLAALIINWRLLRADVLSADALVHQYWMWHWRDPQLFNDALTAQLRESARYPDGYVALFWLASHVAGPITFGEWLGIALMAVSGWLIFGIVREHTAWRPAAWIAAGLFLALIDIQRFYGGFPRAFVHPVVLATVLLALRRRDLSAALVAAGGALFYAPGALLAVGVLIVSSLRWRDRRPRVDTRRALFAGLALVLFLAAVIGPELASGGAPRVFTRAEAHAFPEFRPGGTLPYFADSTLQYLRHNRSGFDLRTSGSILAVAALVLLLIRPANLRLLRAEVLAIPVVSLAAYGLAQAVLFRLYLPHRYTYPLIAFFAIAIGVALRPTWAAAVGRRAALPAALTGVALVSAILFIPDRLPRGTQCEKGRAAAYLGTLPKDAVIAGDPIDLMCVPVTARRPVVISTQLAPAYEVDYFLQGRARMFAMLGAYYGQSVDAIVDLNRRYGATHLWVRRDAIRKVMKHGGRWRSGKAPYGPFVRRLVSRGEPAVLHLPAACRTFRNGPVEVYDIRCLSAADRA
jgi:hypothetical protein